MRSSRTMIVITIASTPSLNASIRPAFTRALYGTPARARRGARHRSVTIERRRRTASEGGGDGLRRGPRRPRRRRPPHGDPDVAPRPRRGEVPRRAAGARYASGNELRQTGDPDDQQRDLVRLVRATAREARLGRVPRDRGRRDHAAQELRRDRRLHRRGPPPCARPAWLLEPAHLQHVPQRRLYALEHADELDLAYAAARAHNRGILEFCSRRRPAARHLLRPARDPSRATAATPRRHRPGRRGDPRRLGLPTGLLAEPPRPVRRLGPARRGRRPGRLPRRGHG